MESRTEKQILKSMLQKCDWLDLSEEDIVRVMEGKYTENQYVLDLAAHSYIIAELERLIKECSDNTNLDSASGEALDVLGQLVGVSRIEGVPSLLELSVELPIALDGNLTVPAGTPLLIEEVAQNGSEYVTCEDLLIPAGVTSANVMAKAVIVDYLSVIPSGCVTGLEGYANLVVSNVEDSTHGSSIEEDDFYRERIKRWSSSHRVGTRACITDYLLGYEGVDDFRLVPLYDGVGSLKIVVDTISSLTEQIAIDVYKDCMLLTDNRPLVVLPDTETIRELILTVSLSDEIRMSQKELSAAIQKMVQIFINGGTSRTGKTVKGMSISENLYPSKIVQFLLTEFPEITNIVCGRIDDGVEVPFNNPLVVPESSGVVVDTVTVRFDSV